jgi:hypothetical protein
VNWKVKNLKPRLRPGFSIFRFVTLCLISQPKDLHGYFAANAAEQPNILRLNYVFLSPYNGHWFLGETQYFCALKLGDGDRVGMGTATGLFAIFEVGDGWGWTI